MAADDLDWVRTIQEPIAREAMHILSDLIGQFDLGRSGTLRVSGYAHNAPEYALIGQNDHWLNRRTQVAEMLVARGVLERAEARFVGGYAGAGAETGDFLFAVANEQVVRRVHAAFEERFKPSRRPSPATNTPRVIPVPPPTQGPAPPATSAATTSGEGFGSPIPHQSTNTVHLGFWLNFRATLGKGLAWVAIGLIVLLIFFVAARMIPGFGDLVISVIEATADKSGGVRGR